MTISGKEPDNTISSYTYNTTLTYIPSFVWGPEQESTQYIQYMQYLQQYIHIDIDDLSWCDSKPPLNFLDIVSNLPYRVSGTTDAFIRKKPMVGAGQEAGLVVLFELKKDLDKDFIRYHKQAMMQLICASLLSNYIPIVVLTDLDNHWVIHHMELNNNNNNTTHQHRNNNNNKPKHKIVYSTYYNNVQAIDMINRFVRIKQYEVGSVDYNPRALKDWGIINPYKLDDVEYIHNNNNNNVNEHDPSIDIVDDL